ncbi:MAG: hypothetical protein J2P27_14805 [Actinobacteria bacterium]|nr:hypothetical protein [Actinomycetota bacterium]
MPRGDAVIPSELVADAMITRPKVHDLNVRLEELRDFFEDDHVQMALIVAANRRLVTTIERSDLTASSTASRSVAELGTLAGRTTGPAVALDAAAALLLKGARRRLAVVDDSGRLLGLLCLKKDLTGYCSDERIRFRCGPIV